MNEELRIILGGDFNVTLDSDRDCSSGRPFRKDSVKDIQDSGAPNEDIVQNHLT